MRMDTVVLVLIVVGVVLGLVLLWFILPKILGCLGWVWRRVFWPPLEFFYDYIMTPIGHCLRDCTFTIKEGCCDCCDSCDTCCSPYKRV